MPRWRGASVLVIGAGPAGLLAALVLSRSGCRVVVAEYPGRRSAGRPQWHHVHLIDQSTWETLRSLIPGLDQEMVRLGAPVAAADADSLDGCGRGPQRAFPDRRTLDTGLGNLCRDDPSVECLDDNMAGRLQARGPGFVDPVECDAAYDLVIDCSGTARASLPRLPAECHPFVVEGTTAGAHASLRVTGLEWPDKVVGHLTRDADGLGGCLLRRCSAEESLISWLLPDETPLPRDAETLLRMTRRCSDPRIAELMRHAIPAGPVRHWRGRRMSRLGFEGGHLPGGWLALGDALLHTPPRQGRGLAQLGRQLEVLAASVEGGVASREILRCLLSISSEAFLSAWLAQSLWEQAPPIRGSAAESALALEARQ